MTASFAMPTTADEEKLACEAMGLVKASGVQGEQIWEAAAAKYNSLLGQVMLKMRDTLEPSSGNYTFAPIDRTRFKQFWEKLSNATILPRAGVSGAMFPQAMVEGGTHSSAGSVSEPGGGAGAGARVGTVAGTEVGAATGTDAGHPKLTAVQLRGLSGNQLRKACRLRSIRCSNKTQVAELRERLTAAGCVVPADEELAASEQVT